MSPESVVGVQIIPKDGPGELPAKILARVVGCLSKSGADWVLTNATAPERIERTGAGPNDASRPLGTRSMTLKFVLTRLDPFVGQRMSVSGMLIGAGGADGINVTTVAGSPRPVPKGLHRLSVIGKIAQSFAPAGCHNFDDSWLHRAVLPRCNISRIATPVAAG